MKRYLFYLIALICWPLAVFGKTYHLKVEITPHGDQYGASVLILNPDGSMDFVGEDEGDIPEGKVVRLFPWCGLEGYTLKEWKEDGTVISLDTKTTKGGEIYADYIMPGKDVVLTAVFSNDSDNPENPDPPQPTTFKFKVSADHYGDVGNDTDWGYIGKASHIKNGRNYVLTIGYENELSEGDTIQIYAQSENQYWKLKEWKENEVVKKVPFTYDPEHYDGHGYDGYYEYIMPAYDVNLVAYFEPAIASPDNPGVNQVVGGTLVLNDFKPGGLSQVMLFDMTSFNSIVVIGDMREKDLSIAKGTNATTFDLTRTYGYHTIPWSAFAGGSSRELKLEHILLPSCIDSIASAAFANCTSLKQLTILATTPPKLSYGTLTSEVTVKVPEASLALYKAAEVWKDLTIEAITDEVSDLTLMLPNDYADGRYKNMSIELVNETTDATTKYIVTDNQGYTFRTLVSNIRYTAYLKTSSGKMVSSIANIFVGNGEKTLWFADIRMPQDVTLIVKTLGRKDVTADVEITWMDASDRFICKGNVAGNIPQGTILKYSIKLSDELARQYVIPSVEKYTVKAFDNTLEYTLQPFAEGWAQGNVTSSDGFFLENASVRIVQTVNGKYTTITETTTNYRGDYSIGVPNVPATITVGANGYVMKSINRDQFSDYTQKDFFKLKAAGPPSLTVSYAFTFAESVVEGGTPTGNTLFSDLANVDFRVYNSTKGKDVTEFINSYPQIVVYDDVASGDELAITASSLNRSFTPVTVNLTVGSDGHQNIVFPLKQLGGIDASFASTTNASVVGILYNNKQQFVQMKRYEEALLSIRELPDGTYTLITMKEDDRYNKIQSLSQYDELGLTEGEDYVKNDVNVVSGIITTVENDVIPASQLGDVTYTNADVTYFAVSDTKSTIDCYVTVRSKVEFNDEYADGVTNPKLIVDIPDGCDFVEQSVIVGSKPVPYIYEGRRLSVPLSADYDFVKFCILPKTEGNYRLGGNAQFSYGGKATTEPIGTAFFRAEANGSLSFTIPPTTVDSVFYASGTASMASIVKVYVDGKLNAQTTANANGNWSTKCQLNNPANLSTHQVQAIAEAATGESSSSSVQTILYDQNGIVVESVTMSHYNPERCKTYEVVFGFNTEPLAAPSYTVCYPQPDFTFSVKLNTVDSERISDMVLYTFTQRGDTVTLYPVFNPTSQTWVASHTYLPKNPNIDPPVNVAVDFNDISHGTYAADREALNQIAGLYQELQDSLRHSIEEIKTVYGDFVTLLKSGNATQEELDAAAKRLANSIGMDLSLVDDTQMTAEELEAALDSLMGENWQAEYESLMTSYNDFVGGSMYGTFGAITVDHCTGLTEASLPELGYEKILTTDSTFVYLLTTEDEYAFVDFATDRYIRLDLTALNADAAAQVRKIMALRKAGAGDLTWWLNKLDILNTLIDTYDGFVAEFDKIVGTVQTLLTKRENIVINALNNSLNGGIPRRQVLFLNIEVKILKTVKGFLDKVLAPFIKGAHNNYTTEKALEKLPLRGQIAIGLFKSGLSLYSMIQDEKAALDQMSAIIKLHGSIPNPCKDDEAAASALRSRVVDMGVAFGLYHFGTISADVACLLNAVSSLPLFIPPAVLAGATITIINFCVLFNALVVNPAMNKEFAARKASCEIELSLLECNKEKKKKDKSIKHKSNNLDAKVLIDPSGYVYEGVASNRLEGVMTTIFYKQQVEDVYGDKHDAENYDQQNPLYTDKDGHYEWYVPEGMWQVKYEKDGYQTAYSEWLPVPPPQLDVNQAMIQTAQPEVTMAHCYPTGIEVEFSKYMKPSTLNNENIFLTHAGKKVGGKVIMLNEEKDLKGNKFASKVRFVADEKIAVGEQVQLTVSHKVKSYADVMMPNDFTQTFTIEHEISEIVADSVVRVTYGTDKSVVITATPAEAAKGKTLQVVSGMAMIATTDKTEYVLDEKGQAKVTIKGLVPGSTALLFSIKEYSASAMTNVEVLDPNQNYVAEPKSSIASGSEVTKGQQITLTCETPGAVIYYTLDGSCPCNDTPSRQIYSGPITITDNVTVITAMAAAKDLGESDIVTFNYHLHGYTGIDELSSSVNIWPLVTRSNVNVDLGGQKARSVSVMNVNGVRLFNATNVSEQITIDFTMHPTGLYIIAVELNNGRVVRKILKK